METNCTVSLFNSDVRAVRHVSFGRWTGFATVAKRRVVVPFWTRVPLIPRAQPRWRHSNACHNAINAVLYVTEKHIAWCVNYKCIITTLLDPLNPESNTSDLGTHFYAFYCFIWPRPKGSEKILEISESVAFQCFPVSFCFFYSSIFKVLGISLWNKPARDFFLDYFRPSGV